MKHVLMRGLAALCAFTAFSGAEASLLARNLDGDASTAEAYYDNVRNITWLKNWQAGAGTAFDTGASSSDGLMNWNQAMAWANALDLGGYDDWRLPKGLGCLGYGCSGAGVELGQLWYLTLGNSAGTLSNDGPFDGLTGQTFWLYESPGDTHAMVFMTGVGYQGNDPRTVEYGAVAVHEGDVGTEVVARSVPAPGTLALSLLGLVALRRQRLQFCKRNA